jgi:hypothetical protein
VQDGCQISQAFGRCQKIKSSSVGKGIVRRPTTVSVEGADKSIPANMQGENRVEIVISEDTIRQTVKDP